MAQKTNKNQDVKALVGKPNHLQKPNALKLDDSQPFDFSAALDDDETVLDEQSQAELLSGKDEIYLPLGRNNENILFERWVIPPNEIKTKTRPHKENARKLQFFSALDRKIAKEMIDSEGINLYPALGQLARDNIVDLIDGLRRSIGCEEGHYPFQVYVTKEEIVPQRAHALSVNANKHVSNGLLEKRYSIQKDAQQVQMRRQAESLPPLSDNKLIATLGLSKPIYSTAMKTFDVPDDVFILFPSPSTLGRNTLNKIHQYVIRSQLGDKELKTVYDKVKAFVSSTDFNLDSNDANARAMKVFEAEAKKLVIKNQNIPEPQTYELKDGIGKVERKSNGSIAITLNALSESSIEETIAQLKAMLQDDAE
ncbi:hypothetical protein AAIA71_28580 (plasmid) [Vibrio harveyi]|uniref:hypothetical protein n=1 Tax=Vibrio harveyi TaxID=669 RepID=UPI00247FFF8B|nr:hypothetical protein [Vibrio harveyi]